MPLVQDLIHKLEVGGGLRYVKIGLAILVPLGLLVGYNVRGFKNMSTQEAMDAAQLGRNIAQGKGFTTLFIRPFSLYLVGKRNQARQGTLSPAQAADLPAVKEMHPDIANPPVYPVVLAGLMKVLPFRYPVDLTNSFWSSRDPGTKFGRKFWRYEPDFLIGLFNQGLFFAVVALTFLLARRLFDSAVAWLSSVLLLGAELLWRFSMSGLSTMLLLLIFMGVVWCLVFLEEEGRAPTPSPSRLMLLAGIIGLAVGIGALTRYAFGWLFVPVLLCLVLVGGQRRVALALTASFVFAAVVTPWIIRNYNVSGAPFGTATFAVKETTPLFPEHHLERSLEPSFAALGYMSRPNLRPFWFKLVTNLRGIVQADLPRLGGSWTTAFFLVGLLVGFRNPTITRLRYFLLACLVTLVFVQSLGHTQLSEDSPEVNSENLLVLLTPLVFVYGVAFFFLVLDQVRVPLPQIRQVIIGVFGIVVCLPTLFVFLPPTRSPVAYPPYFPPAIQTVAGWFKEKELTMSDIPWAMAWYGQRQSVWLTLTCTPDPNTKVHEDFFAVNDYLKPIKCVYLTPQTMDARFLTQWIRAGERSWGKFVLEGLVNKRIPDYFPLSQSPDGYMPEQLVLTDWQRWKKSP